MIHDVKIESLKVQPAVKSPDQRCAQYLLLISNILSMRMLDFDCEQVDFLFFFTLYFSAWRYVAYAPSPLPILDTIVIVVFNSRNVFNTKNTR